MSKMNSDDAQNTLERGYREHSTRLLKRYLDNHCQLSDQEGMSALCECSLCRETRWLLGMTRIDDPNPWIPKKTL